MFLPGAVINRNVNVIFKCVAAIRTLGLIIVLGVFPTILFFKAAPGASNLLGVIGFAVKGGYALFYPLLFAIIAQ